MNVGRLRRLCLSVVMVLALAAALVIPFPWHGRQWGPLFDLAHAPSFFIVFVGIAAVLDPRTSEPAIAANGMSTLNVWRLMSLSALLCGIGLVGEFVQSFVARHSSVADVAANCTGLLAGFCWCAGRRMQRRRDRMLLAASSLVLIGIPCVSPALELLECWQQHREFPLLASFERDRELSAWQPHEADVQTTSQWASEGKRSLQIRMHHGQVFPGASFVWPVTDWTGYSEFAFDVFNPGPQDVTLGISISDSLHPSSGYDTFDRFRRTMVVPAAATQTIRIALSDVIGAPSTRRMNMLEIAMIDLYLSGAVLENMVLVDNLRLKR